MSFASAVQSTDGLYHHHRKPVSTESVARNSKGEIIPKWKVWFTKYMMVWAIVSQVFLLLQVIKIFQEKDAAGVSLAAYIVYIFGSAMWIIYGAWVLEERNLVIVVSSSLALALAAIIVVGVILYGSKTKVCADVSP